MISIVFVLLLIAVAFVLFLVFQFWGRYFQRGPSANASQLIPVDLDAFENLTDPEEEEYLRRNLSASEFRRVQRLRIGVAKVYVATLSENASTLVSIGQSARHHLDPKTADSGKKLVERAIDLKIGCLLLAIRLNAAFVFPTLLSPSSTIAIRYLAAKQVAASMPRKSAA